MRHVCSRPRRLHRTPWTMAVVLVVLLMVQKVGTANTGEVDVKRNTWEGEHATPKETTTPEPEPEPPSPPMPPPPSPSPSPPSPPSPPPPKPSPPPKTHGDKGGHLMSILLLILVLANFAFTAYIGLRTGAIDFRSRSGYLSDRFLDQTLA